MVLTTDSDKLLRLVIDKLTEKQRAKKRKPAAKKPQKPQAPGHRSTKLFQNGTLPEQNRYCCGGQSILPKPAKSTHNKNATRWKSLLKRLLCR